MSLERGDFIVAWLERGARKHLSESQPEMFQVVMLHVGATDKLKQYTNSKAYWQYVQAMLDFFFSAGERAELCAELLKEPMFQDELGRGLTPFVHQAKAEVSCRELISMIEDSAGISVPSRKNSRA